MNNQFSIVFCTCDNYSDLWNNFFKLFTKYWPEYDGKIYLNTESKSFSFSGINVINLPERSSSKAWSNMLYHVLQFVEEEYILIILDDLFFKSKVRVSALNEAIELMMADHSIKAITFHEEPGMLKPYKGSENFIVRKQFTKYKMNATITLFKKDFLNQILRDKESAWDFEVNASIRACFSRGKFLCKSPYVDPIFDYDGGGVVRHGKYIKSVIEYFIEEEGLEFIGREVVEAYRSTNISRICPLKLIRYAISGLFSIFKQRPIKE